MLTVLKIMHAHNYGHFAIHPGHVMLDASLTPVLIGFSHAYDIHKE